MSKTKDNQKVIAHYKEVTGKTEIDMHEVARWAIERGLLRAPKPRDPVDALATSLSRAAQQERRTDEATGRPYRAWHAYTEKPQGGQSSLWVDIDDAPRDLVEKSMVQRRIGIINDSVQLSFDVDHWNRVNPTEEPLEANFDLEEEVEWEKHARDAEREGSDGGMSDPH